MLKLPLEVREDQKSDHRVFPLTSSAPFVENSRGVLIHRPRSGAIYNIHKNPHIGVRFWCGMATTSSGTNLTFLDSPPDDKILCARCEEFAAKNGLPSADSLAGRHVHVGRTIAAITCCALGKDQ